MASKEIVPHYPTQNDENFVRDSLHQLFSASIKYCRYLGLTIFSLNSRGELYFGFFTIPFILVNLRFLSITLAILYFHFNKDKFDLIYPERSKTERLAQYFVSCTMMIGDFLCTFCTILLNRSKIIRFHQNLAEFLVKAVGPLTEANKQVIKSIIPQALKILGRYKCILISAFCYSVVAGYISVFNAFITSGKPWQWWSHTIVGIPLFNIFWAAVSTLRLFPRILMITLFHTFSFCPYILNMQLEKVKKVEKVDDEDIRRLLSYFRKEGELTAQMNDAYGWCLAVDVVLIIISIITAVFSVVVFLVHKELGAAITFGVPLIIHVAILFELFNSAYGFESEILMQQAMLLSQPFAVKPGSFFHANRRTLTGIASAINTYVIVLVQFHKEE
ncbi:unnamed protein product [Orchesella dallaii]|uniref:Gustatory receptor n=1 Tax=Orchesella dallaii TaxID=48710 RepID=A0ABP1R2N9_9HEXA